MVKKDNALAGIDMIIAVIAIFIFSVFIISLMSNNAIENIKLAKETLAMIHITEIFENVGIESFDNVTQENVDNLIPEEVKNNYEVEVIIQDEIEGITEEQNILKKVSATLTYEVANKKYTCSMERLKVKE